MQTKKRRFVCMACIEYINSVLTFQTKRSNTCLLEMISVRVGNIPD